MAYLSMLIVEVYHTHPVLRTFLELLNQTRANRLESDTPGVIISAKNGAFYLAFSRTFVSACQEYN